MAAVWAWNTGREGRWLAYEPAVSAQIEAARERAETVTVDIEGRKYLIDPMAMIQTNEGTGNKKGLRRTLPGEARPEAIGAPSDDDGALADAIAASIVDVEAGPREVVGSEGEGTSLRLLDDKVNYVAVRISKAAQANSRMACALTIAAVASCVCFVFTLFFSATDTKQCHCEKGGVGYGETNGDPFCADDDVEVCELEVARLGMYVTIAACFLSITVLATISNPPRFWLLRELRGLRTAVEQAIAAEAMLADAEHDAFCKRGHQVIDKCDRRVRVDKWTFASVRADWCAFLAQGFVTYAESGRVRQIRQEMIRKMREVRKE